MAQPKGYGVLRLSILPHLWEHYFRGMQWVVKHIFLGIILFTVGYLLYYNIQSQEGEKMLVGE